MTTLEESEFPLDTGTHSASDPGAAPTDAWYASLNAALARESARLAEFERGSGQEGWQSRAVNKTIEFTAPDGSLHLLPLPEDISQTVVSESDFQELSWEIEDHRSSVRSTWEKTDAAIAHWNEREAELPRLLEPLVALGWDFYTRHLNREGQTPAIKIVASRIEESHIDEAPDYMITVDPRSPNTGHVVTSYVKLLSTYTPENGDRLIAKLRRL